MTPWPAIPDLPGHVVEVSRREDGARRRLDLFVHPEGLQPHHVAIRLDLWEGRAPELHAGFGAEARPVCLPEHVGPQERAVEAAAGLVAQVAGEAAAERLRGLWAAARGRLEKRIAKLEAAGELARELRIGAKGFLFTTARATRLGHEQDLHGQMLCHGHVVCSHDSSSAPVDARSIARLTDMSGHEKLDVLVSSERWLQRLKTGFLFEGETKDFAWPSGKGCWVVRGARPNTTGLVAFSPATVADHETGVRVRVGKQGNGTHARCGYALDMRCVGADGTEVTAVVGKGIPGLALRPIDIVYRPKGRDALHVDRLRGTLRILIEGLVAIDPDCMSITLVGRRAPPFGALANHPVVRGIDVPPGLQGVVAKLLGAAYERAIAEAKARDEREKEPTP